MQGTILILDGVSTNRIMLKVQLSAAWYHVVQTDRLEGIGALLRRVRPDLILCAMTLPDGTAMDAKRALLADESLAGIPMIAIAGHNDHTARLRALESGIEDVLSQPYDDVVLLARVRSLVRAYTGIEELRQQSGARDIGFAEGTTTFRGLPRIADIALVTQTPGTGAIWRSRLKDQVAHRIDLHRMEDIQHLLRDREPDVIVVELSDGVTGLRLLADLRARGATRNAAILAIPNPANAHLAADALDRGADDVMPGGFALRELVLRLETLLRRKARLDRYRCTLNARLQAALTDPMTGLWNRRHALPELDRILHEAGLTGEPYAVMLADLDHFKGINDRFGHPAGDAVLIETARRLIGQMRGGDLLARIGGEEFLIALPGVSQTQALGAASRLCARINGEPFVVPGQAQPITVTTSIGLVTVTPAGTEPPLSPGELIAQADRALYRAKDTGRNRVSLADAAAA
ncbi:diguanylate cyclase [Ruegeria pomeroyi]|nr:diguanylate cyclase [Ruegeria pomeroyi]